MAIKALEQLLGARYTQYERLVKLDTPIGKDALVPLYVKFKARLGRNFEVVVDALSTSGNSIQFKTLLMQPVTLWIQQTDGNYLPIHGYVQRARRLGSDGSVSYFQVHFSSWLSFLKLSSDRRDWQEANGSQILSDVFDKHPQANGQYKLELRAAMRSYSHRVQWETDWNFVHRSMEEVGVFPRFDFAQDGKSHQVVVMDDLYCGPSLPGGDMKFSHSSMNEEFDGLTQLGEQQDVQSECLTLGAADYKRPNTDQRISTPAAALDELPGQGEDYLYTGSQAWSDSGMGEQQARIRTEEWASRAKRYFAVGSPRYALPGYWFKLTGHPILDNPQPLDSVVVLKQPYPVKAGDVIGQLGHYLRYTEAKLLPAKPTRPLLHLEVFAGPELATFIQKSRARAKELPAAKTFLEISPGARLVDELAEPDQKLQPGVKLVPLDANAKGKWVKVQPKTASPVHGGRHAKPTYTDSGTPVWVEGSLANTTTSAIVPGWKDFPLNLSNAKGPGADFRDVFRRVDLDKAGMNSTVKDDKGRAWFLVTIGAKDGSARQGWVCEQDHPLVRMCGPWDWPGFELIDNSSIMPVDMLKRYIHVTELYLADESKTEFEASAATVNAGPLITNLEKAIDTDHDGKVTALELKHALETPWMAEALSHLVVRCESEWGGGLGKWEALSPLMKKLLWLWKTEIERIGKLQWWEQVSGVEGFPKETSPWHFHPIGVIGNFKASTLSYLDALIRRIGDIIASGEGGYEA
nr:phage late control D family protein [Burkholderia gladioli]